MLKRKVKGDRILNLDKYMIVISFDAVSTGDLEILKKLPNFKKIMEGGSLIKNVKTIYPSLTYPAHGTIVTGKYPKNHGVIDNSLFKINDNKANWYWYRKYLSGETLYDKVEEIGLKTCSLLWPVTGGGKITYNMPEIFCTKPYHNQLFMSALAGGIKYQLEINKKFGYIRDGVKEPELDDFVLEATKYTIEKYNPNLMLIHLIDVDSHKHDYGVNSKEVKEALFRQDRRLGEILDTLKKKGILENTNIIALGDHSAMDVHSLIRINKLFLENNFIEVNKKGKIVNYKAICKSLDGAAYVYLKNDDEEIKKQVYKILKDNSKFIDFILEGEEIKNSGASEKATFVIEAKKGFYFINELKGKFIEEVDQSEIGVKKHRYKATHGYSPKKDDYDTFFIGYGKGFKKGIVKEGGELIDHCPTLAKILNLEMKNCDGKVRTDILQMEY